MAPVLRGGGRERGPIYWEHQGNRAVRKGRWKLVSRWPGGFELYDLESDRTELRDMAAEQPERARELAELYREWAKSAGVAPWPWAVRSLRRAVAVLGLVGVIVVAEG